MPSAKQAAQAVIDHLPEHAAADPMCELHVKQRLKAGLTAIETSQTIPHQPLKAELPGRHD